MEKFQSIENAIEKKFEETYGLMLRNGVNEFTILKEDVPKVDFFRWLVEKKRFFCMVLIIWKLQNLSQDKQIVHQKNLVIYLRYMQNQILFYQYSMQ